MALHSKVSEGHHDSFTLPQGKVEVDVHPSAARAPEGGVFRVESEDTKYEETGIRAKFVDRGAEVTRKLSDARQKRSKLMR
jgi:myo-inositol-1-phosphate synthase